MSLTIRDRVRKALTGMRVTARRAEAIVRRLLERVRLKSLGVDQQVAQWIEAYFVSGNEIPVERITITRETWELAKEFLRKGQPLQHHVMDRELAIRRMLARKAAMEGASAEGADKEV